MPKCVTFFHFVAVSVDFFAIWYDVNFVDIPFLKSEKDMKFMKGRLKFLTVWNLRNVTSALITRGCHVIKNAMSARTVCHLLAAVHFWFGCYYDWNYVKIPSEVHRMGSSFGKSGKLKFLTFWDALLQAVFFSLCVVNDVVGSNEDAPKRPPLVRRVKDLILPCLAFPLSMFVGLTFWAIYFVDRELIFPRALDPYFPAWLNHVMHTNIMLFVLIELYTSYRQYPSRKVGMGVLSVFMLVYLIWIHVIYAYSGFWVYPILEALNLPARAVFFVALLGLSVSLYVLGEKLNGAIWNKQIHVARKRKF